MHFLIVSQQWEPEKGVSQQRIGDFAAVLRERGHSVSVITSPPHFPDGKLLSTLPQHQSGAHEKREDNFDIYRTRFHEHNEYITSRLIDQSIELVDSLPVGLRSLRERRPDLILATAPPLPSIITAAFLSKRAKVPYVVDLRDSWPDLIPFISQAQPHPPIPLRILSRLLVPAGFGLSQALRNADGLITTTTSQAEMLKSRWKVPTQILRNLPASTTLFSTLPPPPLHSEHFNVVYAGNLGRAQGLYNVLDAVEILQKRSLPIRVKLIGHGVHATYLKEEACKRKLPVDVYPPVSQEEAIKSYADAHTALVSLQQWEPLSRTVPSKLYELLTSGRHITLCAEGESADIIREAQAGDVVPPMNPEALADLWEHLHNNRELLNVGNRGMQWIEKQATRNEEMHETATFLENIAKG